MVLTHLILNGMIKVKGQLGEMAKCIEDPSPRIGDLARLFFKELSTKENALYNNLQDVISHLSTGKFAVDEETFEKTMRYIFTFIEKVSLLHMTFPQLSTDRQALLTRFAILTRDTCRKSKRRASSRSSASVSDLPPTNVNGGTSPFASRFFLTSRSGPSRSSSMGKSPPLSRRAPLRLSSRLC
jgi:hypothetical protein